MKKLFVFLLFVGVILAPMSQVRNSATMSAKNVAVEVTALSGGAVIVRNPAWFTWITIVRTQIVPSEHLEVDQETVRIAPGGTRTFYMSTWQKLYVIRPDGSRQEISNNGNVSRY